MKGIWIGIQLIGTINVKEWKRHKNLSKRYLCHIIYISKLYNFETDENQFSWNISYNGFFMKVYNIILTLYNILKVIANTFL